VEHRSLYATYGKVHGRFLDDADNWHSTWQLAVTLAEAMNRKNSVNHEGAGERERKDSLSARFQIPQRKTSPSKKVNA